MKKQLQEQVDNDLSIRRLRKIPDIDAKYPKQRYAEENMKQCISNLLAWVKG